MAYHVTRDEGDVSSVDQGLGVRVRRQITGPSDKLVLNNLDHVEGGVRCIELLEIAHLVTVANLLPAVGECEIELRLDDRSLDGLIADIAQVGRAECSEPEDIPGVVSLMDLQTDGLAASYEFCVILEIIHDYLFQALSDRCPLMIISSPLILPST